MEKHEHLLAVDARVFRSWFSVLHLSQLDSYMGHCEAHLSRCPAALLDCLRGTCFRLQRRKEISLEQVCAGPAGPGGKGRPRGGGSRSPSPAAPRPPALCGPRYGQ